MWITRIANSLTLILIKSINYHYILRVMKQFRPNLIKLNLELHDFTDEHTESERFMEFLSFYNIGTVTLNSCIMRLRTSAMYLLGPAENLIAHNSLLRFPRPDQISNCKNLKLVNSKISIKVHMQLLFANVKRAYLDNCQVKENMLFLFSSNLEQLVIKKNISHQYVKKYDLLKKIILDSSAFKESLKLLSFEGTTEDETFYSLINS